MTSNFLIRSKNHVISRALRLLVILTIGVVLTEIALGAHASIANAAEQTEPFFIQPSFDTQNRSKTVARFIKETDRAYWYADVSYWDALNRFEREEARGYIDSIAEKFEQTIYPKMTTFFGNPWIPGIDNDPKIYILFVPMPETVGGYTNRDDEFFRTDILDSNEKELVYLNIRHIDSPRLPSLLAHEFQHLITFNQKDRLQQQIDTVWLNELRSEYAPRVAGYDTTADTESNLAIRVKQFLEDPRNGVTQWDGAPGDYATAFLFGHYLAERIGPELLAETAVNKAGGIESINLALDALARNERFAQLFVDWVLALVINDTAVADGQYGYQSELLDLKRPTDNDFTRLSRLSREIEITTSDVLNMAESKVYEFKLNSDKLFHLTVEKTASNAPLRAFAIQHALTGIPRVSEIFFSDDGSGQLTLSPSGTDRVQVVFINTSERERRVGFKVNTSTIEGEIHAIDSISIKEAAINEQITLTLRGNAFAPQSIVEAAGARAVIQSFEIKSEHEIEVILTPQGEGDLQLIIVNESGIRAFAPHAITIVAPPQPAFTNGSLIQALGDDTIYVVNAGFRRAIKPEAIKLYPHLNNSPVIFVIADERDAFASSRLIRSSGEESVYEIDKNGNRRWLNMTPEQFVKSGRSWEAVSVINAAELALYPIGSPITEQ